MFISGVRIRRGFTDARRLAGLYVRFFASLVTFQGARRVIMTGGQTPPAAPGVAPARVGRGPAP